MSFSRVPDPKLVGFCSAPWTDCISYADGALKACDRNVTSFGNWQKNGLKNTWQGKDFQDFRRTIREGRYPDQDCASCHNNGTQRTASSSLTGAFAVHYNNLRKFLGYQGDNHIGELAALYPMLNLRQSTPESDQVVSSFFKYLDQLIQENQNAYETNAEFHSAIVKLRVLGEALEDYLKGELKPRRVATFRQSQLQAKCTARCVMCVGKYTGEIENGPTMDTQYVDEAFAEPEDITDFWCNGAEYLFYKDWKKVALTLAAEGVRMRVSTNGILLTEPTIDFMIEKKLLGFLTMSLDAATKKTMESTRVRVNFEKTLHRIGYLLQGATKAGQFFEFTAAFVMMKRNLYELPDFLRMVKKLMPENCVPQVTVLCQPLENFRIEDYRKFVHQEHHCLIGEAELRKIFDEVYRVKVETGLEVTFYNQKLGDFIAAGMPFPKFFPREMDVEIFMANLKSRTPLWAEDAFDVRAVLVASGFDRRLFKERLQAFVLNYCETNNVIKETLSAFPAFAADFLRILPEYAEGLTRKYENEEIRVECSGAEVYAQNIGFRSYLPGDTVVDSLSKNIEKISHVKAGRVYFQSGRHASLGSPLHLVDSMIPKGQNAKIWPNLKQATGIRRLIAPTFAYRKLLASFRVRTTQKTSD